MYNHLHNNSAPGTYHPGQDNETIVSLNKAFKKLERILLIIIVINILEP